MKSIRELFYEHEGKLIHKWDHYFDIYEKYLSKYRGEKINILEIGISHGGSIQLIINYSITTIQVMGTYACSGIRRMHGQR
jgi:hypothetical protein